MLTYSAGLEVRLYARVLIYIHASNEYSCVHLRKVKQRKKAKIKNRYNQAPHLTQDTTWECEKTKHTI